MSVRQPSFFRIYSDMDHEVNGEYGDECMPVPLFVVCVLIHLSYENTPDGHVCSAAFGMFLSNSI